MRYGVGGLLVGALLLNISVGTTFKTELYQIYEEIYQKKAPQLNVEIDFVNYEEDAQGAEYDWQAAFYLKRDQEGIEERLGFRLIELGRIGLAQFGDQKNRDAGELGDHAAIEFTSKFNLRFYNTLGELALFDFPLLEDVELNSLMDRHAYTFHQDGSIREQRAPIVIDGINYGAIQFSQFRLNNDYQFSEKFERLRNKSTHYHLDDLVIDTFGKRKAYPILITAGEFNERLNHDYEGHNYRFDLQLNDLAYSDDQRHLEMDGVKHHYQLESHEDRIDKIDFEASIANLRLNDSRCSDRGVCQMGDLHLSGKLQHFEAIDYDRFSRGLQAFKQFLRAESFYALTDFDLRKQLGELSALLGGLIGEKSDLTLNLQLATTDQASFKLYLRPTQALSEDLKSFKEHQEGEKRQEVGLCDRAIDRCFDRYIDQFDLTITLSDRYFYDAYAFYLMASQPDLNEVEAREKARIVIRNLLLVNLFFSNGELTLLQREPGGLRMEIHYQKGEWRINGRTIDTKGLTEIGF